MIKLTALVNGWPAPWFIKMYEQVSGLSGILAMTKVRYIDKRDEMMPIWIAEAGGKMRGRGASTEITFENDVDATLFLLKWS